MALRARLAVAGLVVAALACAAEPVAYAGSRTAVAKRVATQLRIAGAGSGAWVADARSGEVLVSMRAGTPRTPASVQKLFTTATALERFGEGFRIKTVVLTDGAVDEDGTLDGSLWIRGSGDPALDRKDLGRLASRIRAAGIRRVTGRVYGDESYFDSRRGLPADGFRVSFYVGPLSALAFHHGTLAGFGGGFQPRPAVFVAERFRAALRARHVDVDRAARAGAAPVEAAEIAAVHSPSVANLVRSTNQASDNYFAEILLKGLGARFQQQGSTTAGAAVVRGFGRELGLRSNAVDGSGLSRSNSVAPSAVGRLLLAADGEQWFDSFYRSLPLAGRSGTLRKRMRGTRAQGRCRAKTGTLSGVSALAGYCRARNGSRLAFALLMNGVNVYSARQAQDRVAAALASY